MLLCYNQCRLVVLVGEGSYDFRNRKNHGDCLIPPLMIATPAGLFASDAPFADVTGDRVPEMAVGRLPVRNGAELARVTRKIKAYEGGGGWKNRIMMVAHASWSGSASTEAPKMKVRADRTATTTFPGRPRYLKEAS